MSPTVSVIMPAYNAEKFIGEAIDSVLAQEYSDFELIIVNDGSIDNTKNVIKKFNDPRIVYIDQANQGVAVARNNGIEQSKGDYLTFLDSDDRWKKAKLIREQEVFNSEPTIGVIFSNFVRFDNSGFFPRTQFEFYQGIEKIPTRPLKSAKAQIVTVPAFEAFLNLYDFPAWPQVLAVKREIFQDLRFKDRWCDKKGRLVFLEDLELAPRLFRRTKVAYIEEPMAEVRRHENNATSNYEYLAYAILNTLMSLRDEPKSKSEKRALRRRIARQLISVGKLYAEEGALAKSIVSYTRALCYGRLLSFFKRLLLLPIDYGVKKVPR